MPEVLSLSNVSYTYHTKEKETLALSNINLSVQKGQFVSIVGPSGCGKSTLLSIMAGLIKPCTGKVDIDFESTGYMLQHDHLFEWRSVYGNVILGLEIRKKKNASAEEKVHSMLNRYGLLDFAGSKPSELSGGMRQRAALIRTLALEPEILLLDEPFSALDYQTRLTVCDDIATIIRNEGKTAIMVTHDIAEAVSVGDYVYVLTKRPGTIKSCLEMNFEPEHNSPLARRNSPLFNQYFNILWKEISDCERQTLF